MYIRNKKLSEMQKCMDNAKTIGWQVGQQPPKIKQTKMNQVVFYTSFDLLGMHKYWRSCSQQQATLFLN